MQSLVFLAQAAFIVGSLAVLAPVLIGIKFAWVVIERVGGGI